MGAEQAAFRQASASGDEVQVLLSPMCAELVDRGDPASAGHCATPISGCWSMHCLPQSSRLDAAVWSAGRRSLVGWTPQSGRLDAATPRRCMLGW